MLDSYLYNEMKAASSLNGRKYGLHCCLRGCLNARRLMPLDFIQQIGEEEQRREDAIGFSTVEWTCIQLCSWRRADLIGCFPVERPILA